MSDETRDHPNQNGSDTDPHVTELLGGYAIGGLDPDEMVLVARHVQRCAECRDELAAYEKVTSLLAYASPVRQVPIRARAALLARVDEIGTANQEQMIVLNPVATDRTRRSRLPAFPSLPRVAAFAAVPIALVLAIVVVMADIINDKEQELEQIQQEQAEVNDFLRDFANAPGSPNSNSPLVPSNPARNAEGRVLIDWDGNRILVLVVGLPVIDDGQHYVTWLQLRDTNEYSREAVLEVDDIGRANVIIQPNGPANSYEAVLVTMESDPNSTVPTGPPVLSAGIPPKP